MNKITLVEGDLLKLRVDAIVNSAKINLLGGGGIDGDIHLAAGRELKKECDRKAPCFPGNAKITGGYNLLAKFIIHTVGPKYGQHHGNEAEVLRNCYKSCMRLSLNGKLKTLAFPAISTGAYGYPKEEAAQIAISTVKEFLAENPENFEEVIFAMSNKTNAEIYRKILKTEVRDESKHL